MIEENSQNLPLVSVLIANYNNGRFIGQTIDSVLSQTIADRIEIIVVDDASTDNSIDVIGRYTGNESVKLFRNNKNSGCGYTKRRCAAMATGVYCAFLDPEDTIVPDACERLVALIQSLGPDYSMVYSTHFVCDENLVVKEVNNSIKPIPDDESCLTAQTKGLGRATAFALFRRDYYNKTGGISSKYKRAVDQDLYYKLDETGRFYFYPHPLYYYRIHQGGISNFSNMLKALRWHKKVVTAAWKRRNKGNSRAKNLTRNELKEFYSSVYFMHVTDYRGNNLPRYYWYLLMWFLAYPTKNFKLKAYYFFTYNKK